MTITAGTLSQVSVGSTVASLLATAATAGTAPYAYQWYRSTVTGFSTGAGNLIAGATALALNDTGLIPGTTYYYKVVATDAVPATATYTQLTVVTAAPTLSQNQFQMASYLGTVDQQYNYNTQSVQVDVSQSGSFTAGQAVKVIDSADGVPKVVACTASSDPVWGFVNYDFKTVAYSAGSALGVSQTGNVIYLYATTAIPRGSQVTLDVTTNGGVGVLVASSGARIVGYAVDKATTAGQLIRVHVTGPSFAVA